MAWLLIKQLSFNIVIGPMDGEDARGINKHSKHKASALYKKALTRLSRTQPAKSSILIHLHTTCRKAKLQLYRMT